jgi:hypothetical protein
MVLCVASGRPVRSAVAASVTACLLIVGCSTSNGDGGRFFVVRDGGRVWEDRDLQRLTVGDVLPSPRQLVAAACQARLDNVADVNLDSRVLVSTNARLLRSAELVEHDGVDAVLASTIEHLWLSGELAVSDIDTQTVVDRTEYEADQVDSYLEKVGEPPSPGFVGSSVVTAFSNTTRDQYVTVIDIADVSGRYRRSAPDTVAVFYVPVGDVLMEQRVSSAECQAADAERWQSLDAQPVDVTDTLP